MQKSQSVIRDLFLGTGLAVFMYGAGAMGWILGARIYQPDKTARQENKESTEIDRITTDLRYLNLNIAASNYDSAFQAFQRKGLGHKQRERVRQNLADDRQSYIKNIEAFSKAADEFCGKNFDTKYCDENLREFLVDLHQKLKGGFPRP